MPASPASSLNLSVVKSLTLLNNVVKVVDRVIILCSMRPLFHNDSSTKVTEIQRLLASASCTHLKLPPLTKSQVTALAKHLLSVTEVPEILLEILSAAQGNPMHCTEIILHLSHSNVYEITNKKLKFIVPKGKISI